MGPAGNASPVESPLPAENHWGNPIRWSCLKIPCHCPFHLRFHRGKTLWIGVYRSPPTSGSHGCDSPPSGWPASRGGRGGGRSRSSGRARSAAPAPAVLPGEQASDVVDLARVVGVVLQDRRDQLAGRLELSPVRGAWDGQVASDSCRTWSTNLAWDALKQPTVSRIGAWHSGHGVRAASSQRRSPGPKAYLSYMTLQAPTWSAIDSIVRTPPLGTSRHWSARTVARFTGSDCASFDSWIPAPANASSSS
jgi:hypothetical protein